MLCHQKQQKVPLSCCFSTAAHVKTTHTNRDVLMGPKGINNRNAAFYVCF